MGVLEIAFLKHLLLICFACVLVVNLHEVSLSDVLSLVIVMSMVSAILCSVYYHSPNMSCICALKLDTELSNLFTSNF